MTSRLKRGIHEALELSVPGDSIGYAFDIFMIALIVANVIAIILETVPSLNQAYSGFFIGFEILSVAIFTLEYVLRVWSCTANKADGYGHPVYGRIKYVLSPLAIVDFLAFAPFYISAWFSIDLRILRIFRLLRLLKLTRYSTALTIIWAVIVAQRRALLASLLIMAITLIFSSSIVYVCENAAQPDKFGSIPEALWWAIATVTTVGYGDVTPITPLGRIFGAVTMILGVGMFALPTGVIATGFANEIKKHDFVVNWRLVSTVPLFSKLDAAQIGEIVSLLTPLQVPPNHAIVRVGEDADSMYFIISGRVEIEVQPQPILLGPGDFFGEIGLLEKRKRMTTVISLTRCQLLELKSEDFWRLVELHHSLQENIEAVADARLAELESGDITERV